MNLRECVTKHMGKPCESYVEVVREERFFCAVFLHCLLSSEHVLSDALKKFEVPDAKRDLGSVRVFAEYAMARDLWNSLGTTDEANYAKKDFILNWLGHPAPLLPEMSISDFNQKLVAGRKSEDYIQSPARWGIDVLNDTFRDHSCLEAACKLNWAFNVKPDIVIELDAKSVVCIEAKVESGQDVYSNGGKVRQTQCQMQLFLMKDLLGYTNVYQVFLGPRPPRRTEGDAKLVHVTWTGLLKDQGCENQTVRDAMRRLVSIEKGED